MADDSAHTASTDFEASSPMSRPPSLPAEAASSPAMPPASKVQASGIIGTLLRFLGSTTVRVGYLILVLALLTVALVDQGSTLWNEVRHLSVPVVVLALFAGFCGLVCSLMVWRAVLTDLGSRLKLTNAWRVMFIGQLGKYVPGSIWPVLAQMELAADHGVPRPRTAVSVFVSSAVMVCTGGLVAAVTLPIASAGSASRYFWALLVVPIGITLLCPPVLNRLLNLLLRTLRRSALQRGVTLRGLFAATSWALLGWICNGALVYVLLGRLAGHSSNIAFVSIAGYALSWVAGFLAVLAPAGAGVREAVIVAVLSTQTTSQIALTVALVSRALVVVCDAGTAAIAAALVGRRRVLRLRASRRLDEARSE